LADEKREKVGISGSRFEFSQMTNFGVNVQFVEGSLKDNNFQEIKEFIGRLVNN
jgi:hypothetical protein